MATINTAGSSFDTLLGIYTGSVVSSLSLAAANDNISTTDLQSQVVIPVVAGTVYAIAVDGKGGLAGNIVLSVSLVPFPANDGFSAPTPLPGVTGSLTCTNVGATHQTGEPNHANGGGTHSIWFAWTATDPGFLTVSTVGSSFDTVVAVYTGHAVNALTAIGSNNNISASILQSQVRVPVVAGLYYIAVDGVGTATGTVVLNWTFTGALDNFATARVINGANGNDTASNVGATVEVNEPNVADNAAGHSLWWTWTAPQSGMVFFSTSGSLGTDGNPLDTVMEASLGTSINALRAVGVNDDVDDADVTSQVGFRAKAGNVYHICVDGAASASVNTGTIHLLWTMPGMAGDN